MPSREGPVDLDGGHSINIEAASEFNAAAKQFLIAAR